LSNFFSDSPNLSLETHFWGSVHEEKWKQIGLEFASKSEPKRFIFYLKARCFYSPETLKVKMERRKYLKVIFFQSSSEN